MYFCIVFELKCVLAVCAYTQPPYNDKNPPAPFLRLHFCHFALFYFRWDNDRNQIWSEKVGGGIGWGPQAGNRTRDARGAIALYCVSVRYPQGDDMCCFFNPHKS